MKAWFASALAWVALAQAALPLQPGTDLERWVRALDAAEEPEWSQALENLGRLGEPAATRVLSDFARCDFTARRARAKLLIQVPAPALCAPVLALLEDPDPQVRRLLALFLGNPALAETAATERVQALARLARADSNDYVRNKALDALVECALDEAAPALERLLDLLPPDESERAAAGLAQLPAARERLIARLTAQSGVELSGAVHVALLRGYGRALAEVPLGGEELRERLPLLRARTHPDLEVQAAARTALSSFVARAAELAESARAERVLARLGEEGWPRLECLRRSLDLAWLERGDARAALELARALGRATEGYTAQEAEAWELQAQLFEGAACHALGQSARAAQIFDALAARLAASRARRSDLFPSPAEEHTEGGGAETINRLHLAALVHLWRALLVLGARPEEVRVELRAAHILFLESRVVAARTRASDPGTLDALFESDLSPYTLVLFNERLAPEQRKAALDQALALSKAWGEVAPLELQGLADKELPEGARGDVFSDPVRLALLKALRTAELAELQRQLEELDDPPFGLRDADAQHNRSQVIYQRGFELRKAEEEERKKIVAERKQAEDAERKGLRAAPPASPRSIYVQLLDYLLPSLHGRALAGQLRDEGRSREARELCERALATLRTAPLGSSFWSELSSARYELLRGSTLMDENRPREAEQAYLESERRLAAIEKRLEDWRKGAGDPDTARQYETQIKNMRGEALLSLAVNANVRMGDPARALEYFERAYDLNQSPFMRILRACYRARSGKPDEARTVLRSVVPVPSLYYNIACTHALLGEKELALDYLERDVRTNCPSPGSLAQKRAWAAKDPDLASLRAEPRFERLLGGP